VVGVLTNPLSPLLVFKQSGTNNIDFLFFLLSFSIAEKETKKLDHQKLPTRLARRTARMMVSPRSPLFRLLSSKSLNPVNLDSDNL
jgi:hypothetical protein